MIGLDHKIKERGIRKHFAVFHNFTWQLIFYDVISIATLFIQVILFPYMANYSFLKVTNSVKNCSINHIKIG